MTPYVPDAKGLATGVFETRAVAYLLHPEDGPTGCAPGVYVVRRRREFEAYGPRLIADWCYVRRSQLARLVRRQA
ncbi:hypothetical protein N5079_10985 [Planotetraspora sp. A-T 1434]|uniref:hypothetical protein n=1 Tax=Planotetraspora sp. A-T 1434 TaxID=2979219 RepID=UPI0021C2211F|nr:hypothetical protein [Planotetraspora sp. A-T 1434]MCT9930741.1 hypothetical protein [Planotetraspora sp. A-T 1434]